MNNYMEKAINQAQKALKKNEVPIGAVIVKNGKIISRGFNCREKKQNAIKHAEIIAIEKACKKLKSWRLDGCEIYVTLEPCPMCAGAILNSRLDKVFFGAKDKTADDGIFDKIMSSKRLNHNCEIKQLEDFDDECSKLLTQFFKQKRERKN